MGPVNESSLEWTETERGPTHFRRKRLADAAGGERLGASLYELPSGGKSWPYHYHTGNEEAIYVVSGEGTLRVGDGERDTADERHPLRAGDYVALPAGPESAHRVENDGDEPLRFLVVSTMRDPDVTVYPDSGKIGVYAGSPPGGDSEDRVVDGYFPRDATVDYWRDEE
ncbi:cupin domain-containing protein [Salinigranum salinum]|uniref:cupin domain-containing protein n=1 Tax=Salinigranum salinum TaxID=1364937 RepID=UPI0012606290|nr:cupin domain-containing protein [Salinigranum salinum]